MWNTLSGEFYYRYLWKSVSDLGESHCHKQQMIRNVINALIESEADVMFYSSEILF